MKRRADFSRFRLGKQPARHDPRTLQMADYLALPDIPPQADYTSKVGPDWGMMLNDRTGDCTCAAAGHAIQLWSANESREITIPDSKVLRAYSAVSGYRPGDPSTDRGAVELDVLKYWRKAGVGGHKIDAFVALEPGNHHHVMAAVELFGLSYVGLALPLSARSQAVWSVPPGGPRGQGAPGSWGGHAVIVGQYDAQFLTCVTWGRPQRMTWAFWDAYCDESYALLSGLWAPDGRRSPSGFDHPALEADLKEVAG